MATIQAHFDGKVFVPEQPVQVPVGTRVAIFVPDAPREMTEKEKEIWERIKQQLESTEPYFPTVEEALGRLRN
ncbi:MAG: hypothetical protein L0228_19230 [Planctomycetes bacterium]|nr:hypothetical protein [Planctomycetota bacterium]